MKQMKLAGTILLLAIGFTLLYGTVNCFLAFFQDCSFPIADVKCAKPKLKEYRPDIPRILHRSWKYSDIRTMPPNWAKYYNNCLPNDFDFNHGWKEMFWTDDDLEAFIKLHFSWFLPTWNSYTYQIQKVDASRYFILRKYGGLYIDLDIRCHDNLERQVLFITKNSSSRLFLEGTQPAGVSNNYMLVTENHPIMVHATEQLSKFNRWFLLPYITVMFSTGPGFLSRIVNAFPCQDDIRSIPHKTFRRKYSFLGGSTWHRWDGVLIWNLYSNWHFRLTFLLLVLFVLIAFRKIRNRLRDRTNGISRSRIVLT